MDRRQIRLLKEQDYNFVLDAEGKLFARLYVSGTLSIGQCAIRSGLARGKRQNIPTIVGECALKSPEIREEINRLYAEEEEAEKSRRQQLIKYCINVLTTPAGELTEDHPLCQEVEFTEEGDVRKIKMPSKATALAELAKLTGAYESKKLDVNVKQSGVMAIPLASSKEEWEKLAVESQRALQDSALDISEPE